MSVHVERAKKWNSTPWMTEWLDRTVKYCRGEGKAAFESWVIQLHGKVEGRKLIAGCSDPPKKTTEKRAPGKGLGNPITWNKAALEFGVTDDTLRLYHRYASLSEVCTPPRTTPAPRRRRGEPSSEWIARRHQALLLGAKIPNLNWETARAIALSEYDRVRETAEMWRTELAPFVDGLKTRAKSAIPSPEILGMTEEYIERHTFSDAFISRNYALHLAHSCWYHAALLFEDLARQGLCTASAIERAYQRDENLMWRLFVCQTRVRRLIYNLWEKVTQVVTYSEYYRPYFKRRRTSQGVAKIEINEAYRNEHPIRTSEMDAFILEIMSQGERCDPTSFYDTFNKLIAANPPDAKKFSDEAYEALGDFAVAMDFDTNITLSTFGMNLDKYAFSKGAGTMDPLLISYASSMDPTSLVHFNASKYKPAQHPYSIASVVYHEVTNKWLDVVHQCDVDTALEACKQATATLGPTQAVPYILTTWDRQLELVDRVFWDTAAKLDRQNEPGRVAREFGLLNPNDPNRPTLMKKFHEESRRMTAPPLKPVLTPAPAASTREESAPTFPVSAPTAQSGHSYVAGTQANKPKEKVKTKSENAGEESGVTNAEEADDSLDSFPDFLPPKFKLPKKVLKVFHNVLDFDQSENVDANAPKRGQVRWGDFEWAMKRVGFDAIQTAGSSVRFEPPARTARPISFHRPHPDSTMDPFMLKIVGTRLRRCYGWTIATFELGLAEGQPGS